MAKPSRAKPVGVERPAKRTHEKSAGQSKKTKHRAPDGPLRVSESLSHLWERFRPAVRFYLLPLRITVERHDIPDFSSKPWVPEVANETHELMDYKMCPPDAIGRTLEEHIRMAHVWERARNLVFWPKCIPGVALLYLYEKTDSLPGSLSHSVSEHMARKFEGWLGAGGKEAARLVDKEETRLVDMYAASLWPDLDHRVLKWLSPQTASGREKWCLSKAVLIGEDSIRVAVDPVRYARLVHHYESGPQPSRHMSGYEIVERYCQMLCLSPARERVLHGAC